MILDGREFDAAVRRLATASSRRAVVRGFGGVAIASALSLIGVERGAAQDVGTASCATLGARCGRRDQPSCNTCCSNYALKQPNGQRRCSCRPDMRSCSRGDQCCSGLCCNQGSGRFCFPGLFTCNGRCPEDDPTCSAPAP